MKEVRRNVLLRRRMHLKKFGVIGWNDNTDPAILDLITDLKYRGDFKTKTRERTQPYVVRNDFYGLSDVMKDKSFWRKFGVPADRIQRRIDFLKAAGPAYEKRFDEKNVLSEQYEQFTHTA